MCTKAVGEVVVRIGAGFNQSFERQVRVWRDDWVESFQAIE